EQASSCFTKPHMLDKISGSVVKYSSEKARKMALTKSGPFCQHLSRKLFSQMTGDPGGELCQTLHRAGLGVRPIWKGIILSRRPKLHSKFARDRKGKLRPMVFLNQR